MTSSDPAIGQLQISQRVFLERPKARDFGPARSSPFPKGKVRKRKNRNGLKPTFDRGLTILFPRQPETVAQFFQDKPKKKKKGNLINRPGILHSGYFGDKIHQDFQKTIPIENMFQVSSGFKKATVI